MRTKITAEESGQALLELAFALVAMLVVIFGIVDFGRAIYDVQVLKNLAGEGSSMASRGTDLATTATTVGSYAGSDISISSNGCVIVTSVTNQGGTLTVTGQASYCGISATSKIGCVQGVGGCVSGNPTLPSAASTALSAEASGSSLFVTEIYYNFSTVTPVSALLGGTSLPTQFYTATYY